MLTFFITVITSPEIDNVQNGVFTAEEGVEESLVLTYTANPTATTLNLVRIDALLDLNISFSNPTLVQFVPERSDSGIYMVIIANSFTMINVTITLDVHCKDTMHSRALTPPQRYELILAPRVCWKREF